MSHHFIEDEALLRQLSGADRERIARWLKKQRTAPHLIGTTAAAKILGIRVPHVSRLRDQGRMPEPIPVEGSVDVYVKEEVEALAVEVHAEREARAARRNGKKNDKSGGA